LQSSFDIVELTPLQSERMAGNEIDHKFGDLLARAEAQVWLVRLETVRQNWPDWESALTPEETAKASRFLQPADRFRSAASRAVLRRLLSHYLDLPPAEFQFVCNRFGKPALAGSDQASRLNFSVSHSHEYALLGFSAGRPIGVDIEWVRANPPFHELAVGICAAAEIRMLESLPDGQRLPALYQCWTLKESYLKTLGVGLSHPPQRVRVAWQDRFDGSSPPKYLLHVRGKWTAVVIDAPPGYAASVVTAGRTSVLVWRDMDWRLPCRINPRIQRSRD
jgi:4'-phosphopantetheinyl transferase